RIPGALGAVADTGVAAESDGRLQSSIRSQFAARLHDGEIAGRRSIDQLAFQFRGAVRSASQIERAEVAGGVLTAAEQHQFLDAVRTGLRCTARRSDGPVIGERAAADVDEA